jgi:hypothetical protein
VDMLVSLLVLLISTIVVSANPVCNFTSWKSRLSVGLFAACGVCDNDKCACFTGFMETGGDSQRDATVCTPCSAGMYSSDGKACISCPVDTYGPTETAAECRKCPVDSYASLGSASCTCRNGFAKLQNASDVYGFRCVGCGSGQYPSSSGCLNCPVNTFASALSSSCTQCPPGSASPPGSHRCECDVGLYSVNPSHNGYNLKCALCPPGTTSDRGSTTCKCPGGTKQEGTGNKIKCYRCPAGKYSKAGDIMCTSECFGNTYNAPDIAVVDELPLTGVCKTCPENSKAVMKQNASLTYRVCECFDGYHKVRSLDVSNPFKCLPAMEAEQLFDEKKRQKNVVLGGGAVIVLTVLLGAVIIYRFDRS